MSRRGPDFAPLAASDSQEELQIAEALAASLGGLSLAEPEEEASSAQDREWELVDAPAAAAAAASSAGAEEEVDFPSASAEPAAAAGYTSVYAGAGERVRARAQSASAVAAPPAAARRAWYVVWFVPNSPELTGIWEGPGDGQSWELLRQRLPAGQYQSGRDRLRRAFCASAALALYRREAARHGAPAEPRWNYL